MPESIIGIIAMTASLLYVSFRLVKRWMFIRNHKICPHCGNEMTVSWEGKEVDAQKEKVTFGGKRMLAGKAIEYTSRLRCSHCGHEIPL